MFKVGDKVKFKPADYVTPKNPNSQNKAQAKIKHLDINAIYEVEDAHDDYNGFKDQNMVTIKGSRFYADRFTLAEPEPAKEPVRQFAGTIMGVKIFDSCLLPIQSPVTTRILHSGITTITFFSDGSKMVTRPSADDVAKFDPFVGWCVGVTAKLFGGKVAAKKFYKAHAVVQKAAIDPIELEPEQEKRECDTCGRSEDFKTIHCLECHWPELKYWRDNSPIKPEVSHERKVYDDSVSKRYCYVCDGYHSLSNFAPCKGCWETGKSGHHPNFTALPFTE